MKRGDKTCSERDIARVSEKSRYFTSRPCINGHVSERYTAGGACVECTKCANHRSHQEHATERKKYMRDRCSGARTSKFRWAAEVIRAARVRARIKNIGFDITVDDIELPEFCPVFGVRIIYDALEPRAQRPSLDRTDNSKGYVKGNVRVISFRANQIKNDATSRELSMVLKYVESMEAA